MKKLIIIPIFLFTVSVIAQDNQSISSEPKVDTEALVKKTIDIQSRTIKKLQSNQVEIDNLDFETKKLVNEYKDIVLEYQILKKYDDQLEQITLSQLEEINDLSSQIESLDETNKYVLPLLKRMTESLRTVIELDVPFLLKERYTRLEELENILFKANFSTAEKFRKIFEAFQIENEYGRTIEYYSGSLDVKGQELAVDFFRLGRLNLFYKTPDGGETGYWDKGSKSWNHLGGKHKDAIESAIKIAMKQSPPNFILLPIQPAQ